MVLSRQASSISTVQVPLYQSYVCYYRSTLSSVPIPTYAYTYATSDPNLSKPRNPPITSTYNCACLFLVRIAYGGRGSCIGSGPALEHQNRPYPSGRGDIISRPYAFWVLKNMRIARRRRQVPPMQIRGGSAVFLPKVHSQRITVGGSARQGSGLYMTLGRG